MRVLACTATVVLTACVGYAAEAISRRTPTFESGVEMVNLDVSVSGRGDRTITDLQESDFEVFEDGQKQEIAAVVMVHGGRVFNVLTPAASPAPATPLCARSPRSRRTPAP